MEDIEWSYKITEINYTFSFNIEKIKDLQQPKKSVLDIIQQNL